MIAQETKPLTKQNTFSRYEDIFPIIIVLLVVIVIPIVFVALLQGRVAALSLELEKTKNFLIVEEEKLEQLNYRLKEIKSLQSIEKTAISLGMVKNNKTEIVVLAPPVSLPTPKNSPLEAGPVEIKGAVTASLFNRLLDFLYGLLGG